VLSVERHLLDEPQFVPVFQREAQQRRSLIVVDFRA